MNGPSTDDSVVLGRLVGRLFDAMVTKQSDGGMRFDDRSCRAEVQSMCVRIMTPTNDAPISQELAIDDSFAALSSSSVYLATSYVHA